MMFKSYNGKWVSKNKKPKTKNAENIRYYSNGKKMILVELIKE